ncbi:hypothetical protein GGG16DRAFT_107410 [Schizophyllum commune]
MSWAPRLVGNFQKEEPAITVIAGRGVHSKGRGVRRAPAPDDMPPAADPDDDFDEISDGDEDHRPGVDDDGEDELVEGDDDDNDNDIDPAATMAFMDGSDDEAAQQTAGAQTASMSARERARRDEEPLFSDSDDDDRNATMGVGPAQGSSTLSRAVSCTSAPTGPTPPSPPSTCSPTDHSLPRLPALFHAPMVETVEGYDESALLVLFYQNQRMVPLKLQHPVMQTTVRVAVKYVKRDTLFVAGFAEPSSTSMLNHQRLMEAAESVGAHGIRDRLMRDPTFSPRLDPLLNNRAAILRSKFKENADSKVVAYYHLPKDDTIGNVIRTLTDQAAYHYFQKDDGSFVASKPYSHPCITAVIQDVVFTASGSRSLSHEFADMFYDAASDEARPELPIAMVALAATAVCAALEDRSLGVHNKKTTEFSSDTVFNIYEDHVRALTAIRDSKPAAFHRLMADLFKEVSGAKLRLTNAGPSRAMAMLNIEAMAV